MKSRSPSTDRRSAPRLRLAALVLVAAVVLPPAGCSLIYRSHYRDSAFTIYSDREAEFVRAVGDKARDIYRGFSRLFEIPPEGLGLATIVFRGSDSQTVDYGYTSSLLGYYVPFINYIHIDTDAALAQGQETLDGVLLHEIAHHFIVTGHPAANRHCWLNEGLAGTLEVTQFEGSYFEYPLVNPILFQVARSAAKSRAAPRLRGLLDLTWKEFHDDRTKERNYALAWSFVYYYLEWSRPSGEPLGRRIETLHRADREALAALEPGWLAFLRGFDLTGHLLRLARDGSPARALTARWAIRQLGAMRSLDALRVLEGLADLFHGPDLATRQAAYLAFLRVAERAPRPPGYPAALVRAALDHVDAVSRSPDVPAATRSALVHATAATVDHRAFWLPRLISLLEAKDGDVRSASAAALSRLGTKPTIVNPEFWRSAPAAARAREVDEWRAWIARQDALAADLR